MCCESSPDLWPLWRQRTHLIILAMQAAPGLSGRDAQAGTSGRPASTARRGRSGSTGASENHTGIVGNHDTWQLLRRSALPRWGKAHHLWWVNRVLASSEVLPLWQRVATVSVARRTAPTRIRRTEQASPREPTDASQTSEDGQATDSNCEQHSSQAASWPIRGCWD